jgi:hypothetical protein
MLGSYGFVIKQTGVAVTCITEVHGLNLGWITDYSDARALLSSVPPSGGWDSTFKNALIIP